MTYFWSALLPHTPASFPYSVTSYGPTLAHNKAALMAACHAVGADANMCALALALAMVETTTLSPWDRDTSKDGTPSENVSLLNWSTSLVRALGYQHDPRTLNDPAQMGTLIQLMMTGVHMWGVVPLLNFIRGGETGFHDGVSYGCLDYQNTVATILRVMDMHSDIFVSDQRINVQLYHV